MILWNLDIATFCFYSSLDYVSMILGNMHAKAHSWLRMFNWTWLEPSKILLKDYDAKPESLPCLYLCYGAGMMDQVDYFYTWLLYKVAGKYEDDCNSHKLTHSDQILIALLSEHVFG